MGKTNLEEETSGRAKKLQTLLEKDGIDGALLLQKVSVYYFSGTDQDAHLWIPSSSPAPLLMVRKSLERALMDGVIRQAVPLSSFKRLPGLIRDHMGGMPRRIGLELDVLPVNLFRIYEKVFAGCELVDISPRLKQVRMAKSPYEISFIRKAADLGDRLCRHLPRFLAASETEMELAIKAETFYRTEGHPGLVRTRAFNMETIYGHIMAGACSTLPSATPGPTGGRGAGPFASQGAAWVKIESHAPVLVDYASNVDGYLSDQARIFSKGKLSEKFYRAHQVMIEVQDAVAENGRPGTVAEDLYKMALRIVDRAGLSEGFMGHPQPVPFVGHGLGLELDEWPIIGRHSDHVLEEGMIVALEPKCVFPGEGVVGVENTFQVKARGMEKLNRFPEDIVVVS